MPFAALLGTLLLLGIGVWLVRDYLPEKMQPVKTLIIVTLVAIAVIVILQAIGLLGALSQPTPHI